MEEIQDELVLMLRKPVTIGDIVYDKLELREPTAGELSKAMKAPSTIDTAIALISMVAKVPKTAVEGICQRDLEDASAFLGRFKGDSRETSETSSPS